MFSAFFLSLKDERLDSSVCGVGVARPIPTNAPRSCDPIKEMPMGVACKPVAQVTEVNIMKPIESLGSGNLYSARYSIPQSAPSDEMRLFVRKRGGNKPCSLASSQTSERRRHLSLLS